MLVVKQEHLAQPRALVVSATQPAHLARTAIPVQGFLEVLPQVRLLVKTTRILPLDLGQRTPVVFSATSQRQLEAAFLAPKHKLLLALVSSVLQDQQGLAAPIRAALDQIPIRVLLFSVITPRISLGSALVPSKRPILERVSARQTLGQPAALDLVPLCSAITQLHKIPRPHLVVQTKLPAIHSVALAKIQIPRLAIRLFSVTTNRNLLVVFSVT